MIFLKMTSPFIKCARLVTSFFLTVALIFEMKAFSRGKTLEIQKQFHLIYNEILRLKNFIHVHRQFWLMTIMKILANHIIYIIYLIH